WISHHSLDSVITNSPRTEQIETIEETASVLIKDSVSMNKTLDLIAQSIKLTHSRKIGLNHIGDEKLEKAQILLHRTLTQALIALGCLENIRLDISKENKLAPSRLNSVIKILQHSLERHISEISGGLALTNLYKLADQAYELFEKQSLLQSKSSACAAAQNAVTLTQSPLALTQTRSMRQLKLTVQDSPRA
ncbi:MAG: hypothetical protein ACKOAD_00790, partial [Gammaproteobacteria bacterium]